MQPTKTQMYLSVLRNSSSKARSRVLIAHGVVGKDKIQKTAKWMGAHFNVQSFAHLWTRDSHVESVNRNSSIRPQSYCRRYGICGWCRDVIRMLPAVIFFITESREFTPT